MTTGKPNGGYSFGNKAQYRRTLWSYVDECLADVPVKERMAVILDTSEAIECKYLIEQKGYRPETILAVNRNAAEVAWMTRRLKAAGIRGVNCLTEDIFSVLLRMRPESMNPNGQLNGVAINLDLTGPLSQSLVNQLTEIFPPYKSVISVTLLRGRENSADVRGWIKSIHPLEEMSMIVNVRRSNIVAFQDLWTPTTDSQRIRALTESIGLRFKAHDKQKAPHVAGFRWGTYKSTAGTQTMLWCAIHHRGASEFKERFVLEQIAAERRYSQYWEGKLMSREIG